MTELVKWHENGKNKRWFRSERGLFGFFNFCQSTLSLSLSLTSQTVSLSRSTVTQLNSSSSSPLPFFRSCFRNLELKINHRSNSRLDPIESAIPIEFRRDLKRKRREGSASAIGDGDVGDARTLRVHKRYSQLPEQGAGEAPR